MELAKICKSIRSEQKISQKKLAEMVGSNQTEISFIERGFIPQSQQKIDLIRGLYKRTGEQI